MHEMKRDHVAGNLGLLDLASSPSSDELATPIPGGSNELAVEIRQCSFGASHHDVVVFVAPMHRRAEREQTNHREQPSNSLLAIDIVETHESAAEPVQQRAYQWHKVGVGQLAGRRGLAQALDRLLEVGNQNLELVSRERFASDEHAHRPASLEVRRPVELGYNSPVDALALGKGTLHERLASENLVDLVVGRKPHHLLHRHRLWSSVLHPR